MASKSPFSASVSAVVSVEQPLANVNAFGVGTWQSKPNEVASAVEYALKEVGYRHIDCAWCVRQRQSDCQSSADADFRAYGNEKEVGEGIRKSGVPRSDIFVSFQLGNLADLVCAHCHAHRSPASCGVLTTSAWRLHSTRPSLT